LVVLVCSSCVVPWQALRAANDLPTFTASGGSWRVVEVAMRDGVKLHTQVLMPAAVERAPVVLIRTPYEQDLVFVAPCELLVRYGIGCVVQDVRGRRESPGVWAPLVHDLDDGADALAWLEAQPFAESIALYGESYLAATALAAMARPTPKVKTLVLVVFGTHLEQAVGERGLLHHELITAWAAMMPGFETPGTTGERYRQLLAHRPHWEADVATMGRPVEFYRTWLEASQPSAPFWSTGPAVAFDAIPATLEVPVLVVGGFDDPFLRSTLSLWASLKSQAQSLLVLLPTNHLGLQAGATQVDEAQGQYAFKLPIPWLRHQLQGVPLPFEATGVHSWARQDDGHARHRESWPGPTTPVTLRLQPTLAASWPCAQHALDTRPVGTPALRSYRYNPLNPVPSEGGARGLAFVIADGVTPGPVEQRWLCRPDVVRFVTEPRAQPLRLIGRTALTLAVRSSAADTAFIAKLVDVDEHGRALHITDGAATLRVPTAQTAQFVDYEPNTPRTVVIELWPTEWVLRPGHRLGLWVSSSDFPMFSVHLNTATPWYHEATAVLAEQTLELGGASTLTLQTQDSPNPVPSRP
jgi:uncharacterized protein